MNKLDILIGALNQIAKEENRDVIFKYHIKEYDSIPMVEINLRLVMYNTEFSIIKYIESGEGLNVGKIIDAVCIMLLRYLMFSRDSDYLDLYGNQLTTFSSNTIFGINE